MGYYTLYTLVTDHLDSDTIDRIRQQIQRLRNELGEDWIYGILFDGEQGTGESCKWSDYRSEMIELSKSCPNIRLTLYGEGEESGDIWKEHYLNGQYQRIKAKIIFDDFDPSKLVALEPHPIWLLLEPKTKTKTVTVTETEAVTVTVESDIGGTLEPEIKALEARLAKQYLAK